MFELFSVKTIDLRTWVIWSLRKASYRWPPRQRALRNAQVAMPAGSSVRKQNPRCRNFYQCAGCNDVFVRKGVSIDHIEPVVDPNKGWQGFDKYIERMFCSEKGFQILCDDCHDNKTAKERGIRMSEKAQEKDRKCAHCDMNFKTTAKGIKTHAEKCVQNKKRK